MTSAALASSLRRSELTTFPVAAIHDRLADCRRARESLESHSRALAPQVQVRPKLWSYQQLLRLDIRAMAQHAAAAANMIIVAAPSQAPLPQHVERWLDSCLAECRARRPILVALADDEDAGSFCEDAELCGSVRSLASRWQADFMTGQAMCRQVDAGFVRQRIQPEASAFVGHPWQHFGAAPRRYGIND